MRPIDMISLWGEGYHATLGGSEAPGLWMLGGAERLLERARPGVLFADLSACNDYRGALAAAAKVTVPSIVIQGSRDLMTPAKGGKAIAAAIPGCRLTMTRGRRPYADERAARRSAGGAAQCRAQKNAMVRISMLSRIGASGGVFGSSNALWPTKRARPSVSELVGLEQDHVIRRHARKIPPVVLRRVAHDEDFAVAVAVAQLHGDEILIASTW